MIARGAQIRAARALLGWTLQDLADAAGLHRNAVGYWERHDTIPTGWPSKGTEPHACKLIREALHKAGVAVFTDPAPGVCLVPRAAPAHKNTTRNRQPPALRVTGP
jgi:Helix-turn-helix